MKKKKAIQTEISRNTPFDEALLTSVRTSDKPSMGAMMMRRAPQSLIHPDYLQEQSNFLMTRFE